MFFLFDLRVNAILGGTSMRVIDTAFVYYLTWHLEKGRGTWFIPPVDVDATRRRGACRIAGPTTDLTARSLFAISIK